MKFYNLYKLLFIFSLVFFVGCEDDDALKFDIEETGLEIITPASGSQLVLDSTNEQNIGLTLVWQDSNNATSYTVEMAKGGTEFLEPFIAATTNETTTNWSVVELNTFLSETVGLEFNVDQTVDIRILSDSGFISNTSTLIITPYGLPDLPRLAVPGNHQGWNPSEAEVDFVPYIATTLDEGATNYEGYMWLDGEFKFVEPNADGTFVWGNTDWEDDGTFSGTMSTSGPGNFPGQTAGYYFITADTDAGTYNVQSVSWGIIGAATPTGWDSDTDLVYNSETKVLELDIDLTNGEGFKFRGNDAWGNEFDLGTIDEDGFIQGGGDIVFDQPTGNYHVVLDLSNPRRYVLTITAN